MGHGRTLLSESGIARFERCSCGAIHMHIGAMSIRLHPKDLFGLAHASSTALRTVANDDLVQGVSPLADA